MTSLPPDIADAIESLKLAIVRHRAADWSEVKPDDVLTEARKVVTLVEADCYDPRDFGFIHAKQNPGLIGGLEFFLAVCCFAAISFMLFVVTVGIWNGIFPPPLEFHHGDHVQIIDRDSFYVGKSGEVTYASGSPAGFWQYTVDIYGTDKRVKFTGDELEKIETE